METKSLLLASVRMSSGSVLHCTIFGAIHLREGQYIYTPHVVITRSRVIRLYLIVLDFLYFEISMAFWFACTAF